MLAIISLQLQGSPYESSLPRVLAGSIFRSSMCMDPQPCGAGEVHHVTILSVVGMAASGPPLDRISEMTHRICLSSRIIARAHVPHC